MPNGVRFLRAPFICCTFASEIGMGQSKMAQILHLGAEQPDQGPHARLLQVAAHDIGAAEQRPQEAQGRDEGHRQVP